MMADSMADPEGQNKLNCEDNAALDPHHGQTSLADISRGCKLESNAALQVDPISKHQAKLGNSHTQ